MSNGIAHRKADVGDSTFSLDDEIACVTHAISDYSWFVESRLTSAMFDSPECRQVLDLAASLHEQGKAISFQSLTCELDRKRGPGEHVRRLALALIDRFDGLTLVRPNAERLRENYRKRTLREGLLRAAAKVNNGEVEQALAQVEEAIGQAKAGGKQEDSFGWRDADAIFAPLPEIEWTVKDLQLAKGRPGMLAGFGASAKTLSAQALALAVASGTSAWGQFDSKAGHVRHLDYEQGFHATARRYQRLIIGHGIARERIADRLKLAVFPSVFLDSAGAVDAYAKACDGAALCILDAMRGATPTLDENDSSIRYCLDNLTRVSEKTGTTFVVLHHAGKPKDAHSDMRTVLRGSSAIFDACGCVLVIQVGKDRDSARRVRQVKTPAEAEGGAIDDFELHVEDVARDGNPFAGVRVRYEPVSEAPSSDKPKFTPDETEAIFRIVLNRPGCSQRTVRDQSNLAAKKTADILAALVSEGRLTVADGPRSSLIYRPVVSRA